MVFEKKEDDKKSTKAKEQESEESSECDHESSKEAIEIRSSKALSEHSDVVFNEAVSIAIPDVPLAEAHFSELAQTKMTSSVEELDKEPKQEDESTQQALLQQLDVSWGDHFVMVKSAIDLTFNAEEIAMEDHLPERPESPDKKESAKDVLTGDVKEPAKLPADSDKSDLKFSKQTDPDIIEPEPDRNHLLHEEIHETVESDNHSESNSETNTLTDKDSDAQPDKKDEPPAESPRMRSDQEKVSKTGILIKGPSDGKLTTNFERSEKVRKLAKKRIERDLTLEYGIIYENFVDRSSSYEMAKVKFNSNTANGLLKSIKSKEVQTAGFYGDFEVCVEAASKYLGKDVEEEVRNFVPLIAPEFEGIFASQKDGKIAFILKTPEITFNSKKLETGSLFVNHSRYLTDLCASIVVCVPKGFTASENLTTPFENQMGIDVQFKEKVKLAHQNASLDPLKTHIDQHTSPPWKFFYSDDSTKKAYTWTQNTLPTKKLQKHMIKQSQLKENCGFFGEKTLHLNISQIKEKILKEWPLKNEFFYDPREPNRFYETFSYLFRTLAKREHVNKMDVLISSFQQQVKKKYQEFEFEDQRVGSDIVNELYTKVINVLNHYNKPKKYEENKNFYGASNQLFQIDSTFVFDIFKRNFKKYSRGLKTTKIYQKWNWSYQYEDLWHQWENFLDNKGEELIEKQKKSFELNSENFNKICLQNFLKEAAPFLNEYDEQYAHEIKIQIYQIEPARTNPELIDFVTYKETPYEIIIEITTIVEDEYSVMDVLFIEENKAFVVLKSKTQTNLVVFGRLRNKGVNKFTEITNLRSKEAKLVVNRQNKRWVIYDNETIVLNVGKIEEGDKLDGRAVPVYGLTSNGISVESILYLTILPDSDSLYLINQTNDLFEYRVQSSTLQLVRKSENKGGEGVVYAKVAPEAPGDCYHSLQASSDGKALFLSSELGIDVIDLNLNKMVQIKFKSRFVKFKLFADNYGSYLHICYEAATECFALTGFSDTYSLDVNHLLKATAEVEGNKLFDYLFILQRKFGPQSDFLGCPEENKLILFNQAKPKGNKLFNKYFKALKLENMSIVEKASLEAAIEEINEEPHVFDLQTLKCILISRVPMHLASIDNFTLMPLRDGQSIASEINSYFKAHRDHNLLMQICKLIGFGVYESFLNSYENEVFVVSICGRQSSGKSYLLNRVFGTRFDVSSARCTDGIWMSIAKIKTNDNERLFVVLDCEGLFSSRRTETDEMKMCLTLTALSNVTILNQDLSFNRYLSQLFQNFSRAIGRLNSSAFFKGYFLMVIRDVSSNDSEGASKELESYIKQLQSEGKNQFLKSLFGGEVGSKSLNHFEKEVFAKEVAHLRSERLGKHLTTHWKTGKMFVNASKQCFTQIFLDDSNDLDGYQVKQNLQESLAAALHQFYNMDQIVSEKYTVDFLVDGKVYKVEISHSEVSIDQESEKERDPMLPIDSFKALFEQKIPYSDKCHNSWMSSFKTAAHQYFAKRNQLVMEYFVGFAPKENEFREVVEVMREKLAIKLDGIIKNLVICEKTCRECSRVCVSKANDQFDCDCGTNHRCTDICEFSEECRENMFQCSKRFGHSEAHVCSQKAHTCTEVCETEDCANKCIKIFGHSESEPHDCQTRHPCKVACSDPKCNRTCQFDRKVVHENDCGQERCLHACQLCGDQCMFPNHFHADLISKNLNDKLKIEIEGKEVLLNYHICDKKHHECQKNCQESGVCQVGYDVVRDTWENSFGKFDFDKFIPKELRLKCTIQIPRGLLYHTETHNCKEIAGSVHKCDQQCPDCCCFCEKEFGHTGMHGSKTHRNKDKNVFVMAKATGTVVLGKEGEERKYKVGESCGPENCTSSCYKRGRAHFHLKLCRGGDECEAKINKAVVHSTDTYYPFKGKIFDKWLCKNFWESNNWEPPLNPEQLAESGRCSFICGVETHGSEKSFCSLSAWHEGKHNFECVHPVQNYSNIDIAFVCDTTSSMCSYLVSAKATIARLIKEFKGDSKNSRDIVIAFVAYRDHPEEENEYVTRYIDFTSAENAIAFISKTTANYGGDGPEAVLDGLNDAAKKLAWRKDSVKYVFHIADAPPHGKQYVSEGDSYPAGCPCGLKIEEIALKFNELGVKYKLLKIGSYPNLMAQAFSKVIKSFEVSNLDHCEKMSEIIVEMISKDVAATNTDYFKAA